MHEVKDLVRTALAHHFISALQDRIVSQTSFGFARWAACAGFEVSAATIDASRRINADDEAATGGEHALPPTPRPDGGTPSAASASAADDHPLISPALKRLGLTSFTEGKLEVAIPSPASAPTAGSALSAASAPPTAAAARSPPAWMLRRSSSFSRRGERGAERGLDGGPASRASDVSLDSASSSRLGSSRADSARRRRSSAFAGHAAEAVLAQRGAGKVLEYQVKWRGFKSGATWELAAQLGALPGFEDALRRFHDSAAEENAHNVPAA